MNIEKTKLPGVLVFEPKKWADSRGFFMEAWQSQRYAAAGVSPTFLQDNISFSTRHVLRGLHFQNPSGQGKLVFPLLGEIYDVVVDVREGSPTFGQWIGVTLSSENRRQIWVPEGFAHGFCATSAEALVVYKCTDSYNPKTEHGIIWNDPDLAITWPTTKPVLSDKDQVYPRLKDLPRAALFRAASPAR
jgi:dTDP-4-dehydrorhamnose 3,5-epimerase